MSDSPIVMKQPDPDVDLSRQGLRLKYRVHRTDGRDAPGEKHFLCSHYVLDLDHDPYAAPALRAYADACEADYPLLAADLRTLLEWVEAQKQSDCGPSESK